MLFASHSALGTALPEGRSHARTLNAITVAIGLMSTGTALAQTAPSAGSVLGTVEVRDDRLNATTEFTGSYTTGASTLNKTAQPLKETPQSVTVITRQLLDDQNVRTLEDSLRSAPGMLVQDSSSFERTYFSRGFQVDSVQYDGVPTVRTSGFAISPDLAAYDRVEILRGPAALFTGAGSPGGTINLVRKRPLKFRQSSAQATVGSFDTYRGDLDLSLPLNADGSVRTRLVAAHEDKNFFYDRASTKRSMLYGIVEADLSANTTLGLGVNYEKNDMVPMYGGLPRYTTGADIGLPRSSNFNAAWAKTDVENTTVFADINHRFNNDWRLKASVSYMKEDNADQSGSNFYAVNPATGNGQQISAFRQSLVGEQKAVDASLAGSFEAFGRKHDVLVGGNYMQRDYDLASQLMAVPNNGAFNVFGFNPADFSVFPTTPAPNRAATNTLNRNEQLGLYGSLRFALTDGVKLTTGGRMSQTENYVLNKVNGNYNTQPYKENSQFTPFLALSYDLNPQWTTYVSYAETFRSQSNQFTTAGTPLDPATGKTYEAGIKGAHYGGKLNSAIALFRTIEDGRSLQVQAAPCPASPTAGACFANDAKVRSQGLDTELTGEVLPGWQISGGYTFNQTRYLRDTAANANQPLSSFTPRHMFKLWSTYTLPGALNAWTVGGGVNVQSNAYKTAGAIRIEQGGYAVWAARAAYRINRNLTAAVTVNNLFDKTYYQTLGNTNGGNWYGTPRSVMATLQAAF
ncbi:MAG: TonB-dependent siderophore receptor [Comamonadaceae bacterium]|nr:MAG: TonB-dependent siderophore receptor [Comamonadaceae bacterium]